MVSVGADDTTTSLTTPGVASHSMSSLGPGDRVGRYLVIDRLGSGGMGVVYSAYDPELDRKVAIKLLLPRPYAKEPMQRAYGKAMQRLFGDPAPASEREPDPEQQRLLREAQATAQLSDPNVVTVHDVGEHEGHVFVAMEFVEGCTLRAWLDAQRRGWRDVLAVMTKAGAGLAAAHAKGLVHRDFKPDNVMIGNDGRVRVMDFGLVLPTGELDRSGSGELQPTHDALGVELTKDGAVMGTPAYMSPEQFLRQPLDHHSDQFSFCVTLWESLYGERPFAGRSIASLAAAVTEGQRVEPTRTGDVPRVLHRVLERGLATHRAQRYPSMRALLAELARDPSRMRKRFVAVGSVAVVAAFVVGGVWVERARKSAACRREGEALHDIWNEDARARVSNGILATGKSHAASTLAKTTPWLDRYADEWATMRTHACETIALRKDGRELAAKTVTCLDRRTSRFAALVEQLAAADDMITHKAVGMAAGLPPLAECTNEAVLVRRATQDESPEAVALEDRLERVAILRVTGKIDDALAETQAVLAAGVERGLPQIVARSRFEHGVLLGQRGDYDGAVRELTEAVFAATEIDDEVGMARATSQLAYVIAYYQARPEEAETWTRWARVLAKRLDTDGDLLTASLEERLAMVAYSRAQYEDALALARGALAKKEAVYGRDHPEVATTLNNLAIVQTASGATKDAIATIERSLAITASAYGSEHPEVAAPLGNLARLHFLSGEREAARDELERAVAILESAYGSAHPELAKAYVNLGTVVQAMGDYERALVITQRSLAALEATFGAEHPNVAATLNNLGIVERKLGRVDDAVAHHERALAIRQRVLEPGHVGIAETLDALGEDLRARGEHEAALVRFRESLAVLQSSQQSHHEPIALFNVGREELECGRPAAAIEPLRRAVELMDAYALDPGTRADAQRWLDRARAEAP
jgi:tetratricopeptide (TPR) repeat protein